MDTKHESIIIHWLTNLNINIEHLTSHVNQQHICSNFIYDTRRVCCNHCTSRGKLCISMEDEYCFNFLLLCKFKLHNKLINNLGLVVNFFSP